MSTPPAIAEDPHEFGIYEIRLKGRLEARWVDWFNYLSVTHHADGTTTLTGPMIDQAALDGLLRKLRDTVYHQSPPPGGSSSTAWPWP